MKEINYKKAIKFDELYDLFDDKTVDKLDDYIDNKFEVVDYDELYNSLENGEKPVSDDNMSDYLADNLLEQDEIKTEVPIEEEYVEPNLGDDFPIEGNTLKAIEYAIKNKKVIKITYSPQGKKYRRGKKLKREIGLPQGSFINRIIEPHYLFRARTTGNNIVVTWDRSVREIRAYIVDNIKTYSFVDRKPFKEKNKIKPVFDFDTGINKMDNIEKKINTVKENALKNGMEKTASSLQDFNKCFSNFKVAQYVGIQGYWIRNRRCWDNCYRQKRTENPESPAQVVWEDCWKEYLESINNNSSGWEKYASMDKIDINKEHINKWNSLFIKKVDEKIASEKMSKPEAIYSTIEEESEISKNNLLQATANLIDVHGELEKEGLKEDASVIADVINEVIKEADFKGQQWWQNIGKGIQDKWKQWSGKGSAKDITKLLQDVITRANSLLTVQYSQNDLKVFLSDTGKLIRTLSGYSDTQDPISSNLIQKSIPVLNGFYRSVATEASKKKNPKTQRQFFVSLLQSLISNLSNIISSAYTPQEEQKIDNQKTEMNKDQNQLGNIKQEMSNLVDSYDQRSLMVLKYLIDEKLNAYQATASSKNNSKIIISKKDIKK